MELWTKEEAMKTGMIAAVAVMVLSGVVVAGPGGKVNEPQTVGPARVKPSEQAEVTALRTAYKTLAKADHDYKGHRRKAMNEIEEACDLLGSDIRGDGKGHEAQTVSDGQLREAQGIVTRVRDSVKGKQRRVYEHLDKAVKEIGVALTMR
jgi:hypothetical protein